MKLTFFQSDRGDCMLVTSRDKKTMLVDGGMQSSYTRFTAPTLHRLAAAGKPVDRIILSHIDQDHIAGILQLLDDLIAWRVYDYQVASGNKRFPKPASLRPPDVTSIWSNTFHDQVGENAGQIEDLLAANHRLAGLDPLLLPQEISQAAQGIQDLVTSVKEGLLLRHRLSPAQLWIAVNQEFDGRFVFVDGLPTAYPLGSLTLRVLAPFKSDLERLRGNWNRWLQNNQEVVQELRSQSQEDSQNLPMDEGQNLLSSLLGLANELGRRGLVTPPNLASIMVLVEESGRRALLTGDGHTDDVLKGLEFHGQLDPGGKIHVDLLKVPHHGAEHNITAEFIDRVSAEHYVFCGNGYKANPNLDVLEMMTGKILDRGQPATLWFTSSPQSVPQAFREHMRAIQMLVERKVRASRGKLKSRFLNRRAKHEITL